MKESDEYRRVHIDGLQEGLRAWEDLVETLEEEAEHTMEYDGEFNENIQLLLSGESLALHGNDTSNATNLLGIGPRLAEADEVVEEYFKVVAESFEDLQDYFA